MQRLKLILIIKGIVSFMLAVPFFVNAQFIDKKAEQLVQVDTLLGREDYQAALDLLDKIIGQTPPKTEADYQALYKRAYAYYGISKFEEALTDVNKYLEKKPDQQAKLLRAYIFQELGRTDDQLKDINEFISSSPGNPELIRWRASVYMEAGRYKEAQKDVQQLLKFGANPELKAFLGLTYYYLDNADSALTLFDDVITTTPEYPQTYLYAASIALEEEFYDLALTYADKGLKLNESDPTLTFYKGIALVEKEDLDKGCSTLRKAFNAGVDDAGEYLKSACYGAH